MKTETWNAWLKHQTPNSKLQKNSKHQRSLDSALVFGIWKLVFLWCLVFGVWCFSAHAAEPLRALLITGGCCHDYEAQKKILTEGISARANVKWTVVHESDDGKDHEISIYTNANWAKGFDVVVIAECWGPGT